MYNVTSTCKKAGVVIGFSGSGGFLKGNVPTDSKDALVVVKGRWKNNNARLELREVCPEGGTPKRLTINNIHFFQGFYEVNSECVQ